MIEIKAAAFCRAMEILGRLYFMTHDPDTDDTWDRMLERALETLSDDCATLELPVAHAMIKRGSVSDSLDVGRLSQCIIDELNGKQFYYIPKTQIDRFTRRNLFGKDVENAFPSTEFNISEAGKCFALGRHTACVYHLMLVMEVGLKEVSLLIGIAANKNWGFFFSEIDKYRKTHAGDNSIKWRKREGFIVEVLPMLTSVGEAWRNPVMHVGKEYLPDEADEIFNAVGMFMRKMAVELPKLSSP